MKAHSMEFSRIVSSDHGAHEHYHIPKYQREYTWGKANWEHLLTDVMENEPGYFMGSLICVNDDAVKSPGDELIYDVVDGQQRLTTLSLLMMAIYQRLKEMEPTCEFRDEDEKEDFQNSLISLRNKLVKRKRQGEYQSQEKGGWIEESRMCFLRVQPSSQNHNLEDYKYLLSEIGLLKKRERPRYFGIRSICKAYRFFYDEIPADLKKLITMVAQINQLIFVYISVSSQADAFTLFETLNNRGIPLSAIDIIKNKMLAEMERQHNIHIDESYDRWQDIVSAIPDTVIQERFLRQFYHAFRWDEAIGIKGIPRALKSKIIAIYEKLITHHAQSIFDRLSTMAMLYSRLINPRENDFLFPIRRSLLELGRVNAAPAYQVLLYLFSRPPECYSEADFLTRAVDLLLRYHVRRNITDYPNTRDLDDSHIKLIEECQEVIARGEKLTIAFLRDRLLLPSRCTSLADFEKALRGDLYASNLLMTRYLLIKLDETHHSREYAPDLWARTEDGRFVWTVEHVLPQTDNIPAEWVEMIAAGNRKEAERLHEQHVDRLGNLTLSGYNSRLAIASFEKKQALSDSRKYLGHEISIGYRNGLALNNLPFPLEGETVSLATAKQWTIPMIEARTDCMVRTLLDMFRFEEVE